MANTALQAPFWRLTFAFPPKFYSKSCISPPLLALEWNEYPNKEQADTVNLGYQIVELNGETTVSFFLDENRCTPNDFLEDMQEELENAAEAFDELLAGGYSRLTRELSENPMTLLLRRIPETAFGPSGAIVEFSEIYHNQERKVDT